MHNREDIQNIVIKYGKPESIAWLKDKIEKMAGNKSSKDLFMTYSLLNVKFSASKPISFDDLDNDSSRYFNAHKANILQVARIYLLSEVLSQDIEFYTPKVANIIQVADTGELETFLKYLVLLPNPEAYKQTAVEALRTNIAIIFDAISLNNPYPAKYFNDQQWNQMYLKAAFMERDLSQIESVDERANEDLTRIISDYAHERWAASRKIDPMFWRPVSKFLNEELLNDMNTLLESEDVIENKSGALCCYYSENDKAIALLNNKPELKHKVADGQINWNTIKQ
ncbi:EboA domain-containing protein [Maribacter stanieri]|uniref:EboA domain-containing protein n=1 Tax=Maribacter stanieri TaxID=440514 RepID=UPI00249586A2|nr:EboA domain-containing protein [Maribacter stanieri]|tara:strand:+ start:640 stop:1488 length:849 start_codon:yes stop_codon:yes gene_type:complete